MKKLYILIGLCILAMLVVGFLLLRSPSPPELIKIYKATTPEKISPQRSETSQPIDIDTPGFVATPEENTDTPLSDAPEAFRDATDVIDGTDAFLPDDFVLEATPAEDVPVSPYGWGPYPEVPADYPSKVLWEREFTGNLSDDVLKDIELIDRVLVKLWSEGERGFKGGSFDGNKVYPHYHNTIYVRYKFDGDHKYISRARGGPNIPKLTHDQLYYMDLPEGLQTIDMDTAGIDPYSFLGY